MIGVVDYGVGNISAILNIYAALEVSAIRISKSEDFNLVDKIILPGVGSFDYAIKSLENSGMRDKIEHLVINQRVPILGICLGMQMLGTRSDEGVREGLNFIPGEVKALRSVIDTTRFPLPHMGWNTFKILRPNQILSLNSDDMNIFYFLHSFFFDPKDSQCVVATAHYGIDIPSVIQANNVYGIQCHPEKSHKYGISFLKAFSEIKQ